MGGLGDRFQHVLAVALVAVGCSSDSEPAVAPEPDALAARAGKLEFVPNICLVTVDTLRVDHLSCYGYPRATSPRLDAFAAEGVLFERALATMATTLPSHLSMLTGLYPHQHGVESNLDPLTKPYVSEPGRVSIAAALQDAGFTTAAFVSAMPIGRQTGIQAGFQVFNPPPRVNTRISRGRQKLRPAEETNELVFSWLESEELEEPFFLWVHYWDTHEPNRPPDYALERFAGGEGLDAVFAERSIDPARIAPAFTEGKPSRQFFPGDERVAEQKVIGLDSLRDLYDRYDADVYHVDTEFGRLLDRLEARELEDRTIVVFTSDHGQALGDGGWLGHGRIDNVNVKVPLVMRFPGELVEPGLRIESVASLVDLAPTLLGRFELPGLADFHAQQRGEDLLSGTFERPIALVQRTSRKLGGQPAGENQGLVGPRFKFLRFSEADDELYDLHSDSYETENVIERYPRVAERMRGILMDWMQEGTFEGGDPPEQAIDPKLLEELGDLGYAGDD